MSPQKNDHAFPQIWLRDYERSLAKMVAEALQKDFGSAGSSIKIIGRLSQANLRAIRNWYRGRNAPSAGHLLRLAKISPSVRHVVLGQIEGNDRSDMTSPKPVPLCRAVTTNGTIKDKLARKTWALEQIKTQGSLCAANLAGTWAVAIRTARRDISELKREGRIEFMGGRRNGSYRAIHTLPTKMSNSASSD